MVRQTVTLETAIVSVVCVFSTQNLTVFWVAVLFAGSKAIINRLSLLYTILGLKYRIEIKVWLITPLIQYSCKQNGSLVFV